MNCMCNDMKMVRETRKEKGTPEKFWGPKIKTEMDPFLLLFFSPPTTHLVKIIKW